MGYRSEVAAAIEIDSKYINEVKDILEKVILAGNLDNEDYLYNYFTIDIEKDKFVIVLHIEDIKWYSEEQEFYTNLLNILEPFEPNSVFYRIGEDYADIEEESSGENPPYDRIGIIRRLDVDEGTKSILDFLKDKD